MTVTVLQFMTIMGFVIIVYSPLQSHAQPKRLTPEIPVITSSHLLKTYPVLTYASWPQGVK